jgi:hypothetical protein
MHPSRAVGQCCCDARAFSFSGARSLGSANEAPEQPEATSTELRLPPQAASGIRLAHDAHPPRPAAAGWSSFEHVFARRQVPDHRGTPTSLPTSSESGAALRRASPGRVPLRGVNGLHRDLVSGLVMTMP